LARSKKVQKNIGKTCQSPGADSRKLHFVTEGRDGGQ
jgi:hypothetical protein